jgi:hypothetical protein
MTYRSVFNYTIATANFGCIVIRQLYITTPAKQDLDS